MPSRRKQVSCLDGQLQHVIAHLSIAKCRLLRRHGVERRVHTNQLHTGVHNAAPSYLQCRSLHRRLIMYAEKAEEDLKTVGRDLTMVKMRANLAVSLVFVSLLGMFSTM